MLQADYNTLAPHFCEAIGAAGNCLTMAHSTIARLLADGADSRRIADAYVVFCEAIDASVDVIWTSFDFCVENDPKMDRARHEHLLGSVGNFLTGWRQRLIETEFTLWRFGIVANPPTGIQ
jgi:hypothetical protein